MRGAGSGLRSRGGEPEPDSLAPPSGGVVVRTAPTERPTGAALFGKEFQRRYSWLSRVRRQSVVVPRAERIVRPFSL